MNAIIITDYFKNSGFGNYLRSYYLYKYIKKQKKFKIDFKILSKGKLNNKKYNIIILDLPIYNYNVKKITKKLAKKNYRIIALDYILKHKIDCNISIFKKSIFANKNYIGLKYSIIRDEFIKINLKPNKDIFFVSIGSSDIKNIKEKIKKIFLPHFKKVFLNDNLNRNQNHSKQKNYLKKMMSCKMAASNAGTTLLELLFLKKIVFVYPQNKHELNFSKYLKKKGFIIFIDIFNFDTKKFFKYKNKIQKNRQIDKFGVDRIYKIILNYRNEL